MSNPDRLTGLDASFLALEDAGAHMHVGSCMLFEGEAPDYDDFVAQVESRLHLVPRYRQKLAFPPLTQARPVWVDDPHFNPGYHVRHTALPEPASLEQLRNLTGRVLAQRLDRDEAAVGDLARAAGRGRSLRDDLEDPPLPRRRRLRRRHRHRAVRPRAGRRRRRPEPPPAWFPRPAPTSATLIADALAELVARAAERGARRRRRARAPGAGRRADRQGRRRARRDARGRAAGRARQPLQRADRPAPALRVGRRRPRAVQGDQVRARRHGQRHRAERGRGRAAQPHAGQRRTRSTGIELKAMVPMSVRAEAERGALGNRVTAMYAPLPVNARRPGRALRDRPRGDEGAQGVRPGRRRRGDHPARRLRAADRALARPRACSPRQRMFNVVVTNVPGPQFPLYMLGRRLLRIYPQVPLVTNTALGIAIMSYDGTHQLRAARRLRRAAGPRRPRRRAARRDRRARRRGRRAPRANAPRGAPTGPGGEAAARVRDAVRRRGLPRAVRLVRRDRAPRGGGRRASLLLQSRDDAGVEKAAGPGERVESALPGAHRAAIAPTSGELSDDQS